MDGVPIFSQVIGFILFLCVCAPIPASIARRKGKKWGLWYVYSVLLWPVALVHALFFILPPKRKYDANHDECPKCKYLVRRDEYVCPECSNDMFEYRRSMGITS